MSSESMNREQYPWIFLWAALMGSFDYYPIEQAKRAAADKAPPTAIYKRHGETGGELQGPDSWAIVEGVTNRHTLQRMREVAKRRGLDCAPIDAAEAAIKEDA